MTRYALLFARRSTKAWDATLQDDMAELVVLCRGLEDTPEEIFEQDWDADTIFQIEEEAEADARAEWEAEMRYLSREDDLSPWDDAPEAA